jgi:hypothetical protein
MKLLILIQDAICDFYDPQNRMNLNSWNTLYILSTKYIIFPGYITVPHGRYIDVWNKIMPKNFRWISCILQTGVYNHIRNNN